MARPELPLGAYGKITTTQSSAGFTSITKFRDLDGVVRRVKRNGKTAAAAERALKAALINRQAPVKDAAVEPGSKFSKVAELWFGEFGQLVDSGQRSSGSLDTYRSIYRTHVEPVLGELRMREVTTPLVDRALRQSRRSRPVGPEPRKSSSRV